MTSLQNFAHCTVGLHSTVQSAMQARRKVKKFGGASSNVVIIIYLPCWNRVNWSAENWGCQWHPWHPRLRRPWWCVGFSFTLYTNILYLGVHRMVCILLLDENIVAVTMSKNSFFRGGRRLEGTSFTSIPGKMWRFTCTPCSTTPVSQYLRKQNR